MGFYCYGQLPNRKCAETTDSFHKGCQLDSSQFPVSLQIPEAFHSLHFRQLDFLNEARPMACGAVCVTKHIHSLLLPFPGLEETDTLRPHGDSWQSAEMVRGRPLVPPKAPANPPRVHE